MAELIDVLDENGVKTGQIVTRDEVHKKGLWHRAIVVAVINEKNEILIQQRSANKEKNPGKWDISVAGHISTGQDALMAAAREINEEVSVNLGFSVEVKEFRYMYSFRKQQVFADDFIENQFYDFFILRQNGLNKESLKFQEEEVQAIDFVSISKLNEMRNTDMFVERSEVYDILTEYLFRL
ncbi:NUDIX domain-containing protein [Candidatus Saccharibacteria bacterium]|nr:NUDIX domain-containing protein [Candidatus Saccharibacteria bacterium]